MPVTQPEENRPVLLGLEAESPGLKNHFSPVAESFQPETAVTLPTSHFKTRLIAK